MTSLTPDVNSSYHRPDNEYARSERVSAEENEIDESWELINNDPKIADRLRLLDAHNLTAKVLNLEALAPEPAYHTRIYGSVGDQLSELYSLLDDENIEESVKSLAIGQIDNREKQPLALYRALQTLRFARAGKLAEFQKAKLKLICELASSYLAGEGCSEANLDGYTELLTQFVSKDWGLEAAATQGPGLPKFDRDGELTFSGACRFARMAEAFLSPCVILAEFDGVDPSRKEMLADAGAYAEDAPLPLRQGGFWSSVQYVINKLISPFSGQRYEADLIPQYKPDSVHPHVYLPVCRKMIDQCESTDKLLDSALRMLPKLTEKHEPVRQLLYVLFQNRFRVLTQNTQKQDQDLTQVIIQYLRTRKPDNNAASVLCCVLAKPSLCERVIRESKNPNNAAKPFVAPNALIPPQFTFSVWQDISERDAKKILKKAAERGNLNLIKRDIKLINDKDVLYDILFTAAKFDQTEIIEFLIANKSLDHSHRSLIRPQGWFIARYFNLFGYACECNSLKTVEYLMSKFDIDVAEQTINAGIGSQPRRSAEDYIYEREWVLSRAIVKGKGAEKEAGAEALQRQLLTNFDRHERLLIMVYPQDMNILTWACANKQLGLVKLLFPEGTVINANMRDFLLWKAKSHAIRSYLKGLKSHDNKTQFTPDTSPAAADEQRPLNYKKRHFTQAIKDCDSATLKRWRKAGVSAQDYFDFSQLKTWLISLAKSNDLDTISELIAGMSAPAVKSVFQCREFNSILMKTRQGLELYEKVINSGNLAMWKTL